MMLLLLGCADPALTPEGTGPAPAFASPAWGEVLVGVAELEVVGAAAALDVEGEALGDGPAPLALAWDTTAVPDGNHRLTATGETGAATSVEVWVANGQRARDDVAFVQPGDGASVCGTLMVEASVAEDAEEVRFLLDGVEQAVVVDAPWRWEWATTTGPHRLRALARFADGALLERTIGVTGVDEGCAPAPRVDITSPSSGAWLAGDVTLSAEAGSDVTQVRWYVDDGLVATADAAPWAATLSAASLAEGDHRLRAVAVAASEGRTELGFGLDLTPPVVGELSPAEDTVVSGVVELRAAIEEEQGVAAVEVTIDGLPLCTLDAPPFRCAWPTEGLALGAHLVGWSVLDRAGNAAAAEAGLFVDNPPVLTWVSPAEGEIVSGKVPLQVDADDDEGVAELVLDVDGAPLADETWDTCGAEAGPHTLTARAVDLGGQETASAIEVEVDKPFEVALVAEVRLVAGSALGAVTSDDRDVARVDWDLDGTRVASALSGELDPGCAFDCPALCVAWTGELEVSGLAEGAATLTVTAVDTAGATASASMTVEVVLDADGDGHATAEAGGGDCDDADATVFPGAAEACDGVDQDCDGVADDDFDADGDGYLDADACEHGDDCDDGDPTANPGVVTDTCDGRDEDCDGWTDYGTPPAEATVSLGSGASTAAVEDNLFGNVVSAETDALLDRVAIVLDPAAAATTTLVIFESTGVSIWTRAASAALSGDGSLGWYVAEDLAFPLVSGRSYLLAVEVDGYAEVSYEPAATLASADGVTSLGAVEAELAGATLGDDPLLADPDEDRLVWQDLTLLVVAEEDRDADADGLSERCGDCDDDDDDVFPGATEACDGEDADCSGGSDEADDDGDGWRLCAADCDDADADAWPGAPEACDGVDQDCDGAATGEEDADADGVRVCAADCDDADAAVGALLVFADADGDGYGDPGTPTTTCPAPAGYVADDTDCDDADATTYAGAVEACDSTDNDCDGVVDDGWDSDGDGWVSCLECDDGDAAVHPDATEVCGDTTDDDCDGVAQRCRPSADLTSASADAVLVGEDASDQAGYRLAADDLDGDGFSDLVMTAPGDDDGGSSSGALYVVHGPVSGTLDLSAADAKRGTGTASWSTSMIVATGGDLDGDGVGDVLLGVPAMSTAGSQAGGAFGWSGAVTGSGDDTDALVTFLGEDPSDAAGERVALADLDGDGSTEALIAAGNNSPGYVYVFSTPVAGTIDLGAWDGRIVGEDASDLAGDGLCPAGDVDGDGLGDLFVGAPGDDDTWSNGGAAYLVLGGTLGDIDLSTAEAKWIGEDSGDNVGAYLGAPGDVDGDGLADLLVGDVNDRAGGTSAGAAWLALAPMSGVTDLADADAKLLGDASSSAGGALAGPGDLDGDGFADLLVGAKGSDVGGGNAGGAWLVYGPVTGSGSLTDLGVLLGGTGANQSLGEDVEAAGDVDGDGVPDLLIGGPGVGTGGTNAGAVYLFGGAF